MMVGAIYARTHELEYSRLGGLAKLFPVTMVTFLIAAAGISGVPGFNGYISKTLLHHAIEYVYQYSDSIYLLMAEKLFTVTGALTVCYISRLFISLFLGKRPSNIHDVGPEPASEKAVFSVIAGVILVLGLFPQFVLERVIVPATNIFVFDAYKVDYLLNQNFLSSGDLMGVLIPITAGIILMLTMRKFDLFRLQFPAWLSVEKLIYTPVTGAALVIFSATGKVVENVVDASYVKSPQPLMTISKHISSFDQHATSQIGWHINNGTAKIRDFFYEKWMELINSIMSGLRNVFTQSFRTLMSADQKPKGEKSSILSLANLDFNLMIIVMTLIIILGFTFILS